MTSRSEGQGASIGALRVRVAWQDYPLHDRILMPPKGLWLGSGKDELFVPAVVLGADRLELVRVEKKRVLVRSGVTGDPEGFREIALGETRRLAFGVFCVEVAAEEAVVTPVRLFRARSAFSSYFAAAFALTLGALGVLAAIGRSPSDPEDKAELDQERLMVMRSYLMARAELEREPEDVLREDGSGARARGEEGRVGPRFAIQGPSNNLDPHIVRQAALREAQEFGMIGLQQGGHSLPAPLGADGASGHMWGDEIGGDMVGDEGAGDPEASTEEFADFGINPPSDPRKDALSTFAIDVDTGSYAICKRMLNENELPPLHAVRAEEFLNAFDYGYRGPEATPGNQLAFDVHLDAVASPFQAGRHFVRVALQGRHIPKAQRKPVHLVYLVDTSGSMESDDKIGLVKTSLRRLTESLQAEDTVALSTYAGDVREVLPPTRAADKARILTAIDELTAEGSTAMASGIDLAYSLAQRSRVPGEESRVVILSDGDANVGPRTPDEIRKLIETRRKQGITLSTVGFGRGNYKDAMMESLANAGDGNYSYIGDEGDAKRVFTEHVEGLLHVIARDVKLQIEFDPNSVAEYRLIGYENRDVADVDFRNDDVDGGEVGSGHSVTALYDVVLKSRSNAPVRLTLRYKPPLGGMAVEQAFDLEPARILDRFEAAPLDVRFAVAVAGFAEILRGSPYALTWTLEDAEDLARAANLQSSERTELVGLIEKARALRTQSAG